MVADLQRALGLTIVSGCLLQVALLIVMVNLPQLLWVIIVVLVIIGAFYVLLRVGLTVLRQVRICLLHLVWLVVLSSILVLCFYP